MKLKINRAPKGLLTEKLLIRDRQGFTKHSSETSEKISTEKPGVGQSIAMVRDIVSVRLSLDYNSVMAEVGIEMPMPVNPGDMRAAHAAMLKVERLVTSRMEKKSQDLAGILRDLQKKKR